MANRFQNLIDTSTQTATQLPGINRFTGLVEQQTTNRFANFVEPVKPKEGLLKKTIKSFGGTIGAIGRAITVGSTATAGVIQKGLEKKGILKPTIEGTGIKEGFKKQISNIETLKRIGEETGKGGLLTGVYNPSTSVFGNFVRELPVTTIGLAGDIFLDPTIILSKLKIIKAGTTAIGKGIGIGAKALAEEIPAVQKIGDILGKAFITRYGQSETFKGLDISRKVEESLISEKVNKLVSDVIEKPAVIQQRITQIIKGEVPTSKITTPLAQEATKYKSAEIVAKENNLTPHFTDIIKKQQFREAKISIDDLMKSDRELKDYIEGGWSKDKYNIGKKPTTAKPIIGEWDGSDKVIDGFGRIQKAWASGEKYIDVNLSTKSQLTDIWNKANKGVGEVSNGLTISDNELKILAEPIREELDRVGESISKLNPKLLSEETFKANKGTYFPRLYTDYEFPGEEELVKNVFSSRAVNIPKEPFKKRILTEAESLAKGTRIEEAGYPAAKRLTQLAITEQRQKFFKDVSKIATDEPKPGFIQLSDDKALGDLAGKFLPAAEYKAIAEIRRVSGPVEQLYNKALTTWKTFKTAYNPATISRNDITNFLILNPLGGVGPHRLDIYAKTVNELITKGKFYQMARNEGLEISTQQAAELTNRASKFYKENQGLVKQFFGKIGDFNNTVKNFYGSQDKFFKLANFIKGVSEDGLTPQKALQRANFHLIDYSEVPAVIDWLRKSPVGVPFISFTYGVSKPLAKTLLEHPDKLGNYFKILSGIQQMNPTGETPQDRQAELDTTPDWIQKGTTLRLPVKDKYGRGQYVNLQYILPFNILESKGITPSSPVITMMSTLLTNRDSFTGKDITMKTDTQSEKIQKWSTYLIRQIVPSLAPFGYSWEKVKALIQKKPDANGYVREVLPVLGDILGGIKITPIDPTIEAQKRAYEKQKELQELRSNLIRIQTDRTILPDVKVEEIKKIQGKINKVFE